MSSHCPRAISTGRRIERSKAYPTSVKVFPSSMNFCPDTVTNPVSAEATVAAIDLADVAGREDIGVDEAVSGVH